MTLAFGSGFGEGAPGSRSLRCGTSKMCRRRNSNLYARSASCRSRTSRSRQSRALLGLTQAWLTRPLRARRKVPFDQRMGELPLATRKLEAIPLERRSARAGRAHPLPLVDECSDPLLQLLDTGRDLAAPEPERPLRGRGEERASLEIDCLRGATHA